MTCCNTRDTRVKEALPILRADNSKILLSCDTLTNMLTIASNKTTWSQFQMIIHTADSKILELSALRIGSVSLTLHGVSGVATSGI